MFQHLVASSIIISRIYLGGTTHQPRVSRAETLAWWPKVRKLAFIEFEVSRPFFFHSGNRLAQSKACKIKLSTSLDDMFDPQSLRNATTDDLLLLSCKHSWSPLMEESLLFQDVMRFRRAAHLQKVRDFDDIHGKQVLVHSMIEFARFLLFIRGIAQRRMVSHSWQMRQLQAKMAMDGYGGYSMLWLQGRRKHQPTLIMSK